LVGAPTFEIYGGTNGGNGGQVLFAGEVSAPRGIVKFLGLSDFGNLDISWHSPLGAAIKSVTGGGYLLLGANNLMISSGALAAGGIQDGGSAGGTGGSLTKTSSGMLQLAPNLTNTYTGGTTILEGVLTLLGGTMSATGPGPVQVSGGTLSGLGIIAGSLTIGTGSGTGASLQPSGAKPNGNGGFTVQSPLNFQADATYVCDVFTNLPSASRVIAAGVTIQNGAQLSLLTHSSNTIPLGRTFTIIGNTTAAPISGTFSNLPDGVILTAGPNKFQADYQGSDGNDLTLTVVP
jgi:autotransporter-associated beta strand protein